jgi:hypothetical protein
MAAIARSASRLSGIPNTPCRRAAASRPRDTLGPSLGAWWLFPTPDSPAAGCPPPFQAPGIHDRQTH